MGAIKYLTFSVKSALWWSIRNGGQRFFKQKSLKNYLSNGISEFKIICQEIQKSSLQIYWKISSNQLSNECVLQTQCGEIRFTTLTKKNSSNQSFFSENVTFTKFLSKKNVIEFREIDFCHSEEPKLQFWIFGNFCHFQVSNFQ